MTASSPWFTRIAWTAVALAPCVIASGAVLLGIVVDLLARAHSPSPGQSA